MILGSHSMEFPRRIVIGEGVLNELGDFVDVAGDRKGTVVIASGANVKERIREQVIRSLDRDIRWVEVKASDIRNVEEVMKVASRAQCIIGLGGGKSVDVGKLAASKIDLPFFSVPTSASHDGISSPFASIKGLSKHYSVKSKPPIGILADVDVISAAPSRLLAAGCGDLVSKLTAVKDWQLAYREAGEYYGGYAANLAMMSAEVILEGSVRIGTYGKAATRDVVEGLISAGVAAGIAGSSRPCSGSEHLFSHALDVICPGKALHGEQCGVGTIMMARLHGLDWVGVRRALKDVRAPVTAADLGIDDRDVVRAIVDAPSIRPDRYTILSKVKVDASVAREVALETGVI